MIQEELEKVLAKYLDEDGDIIEDGFDEDVIKYFNGIGVRGVTNTEEMFDSPGIDIYSYSIAWEENNKLNMVTYRRVYC